VKGPCREGRPIKKNATAKLSKRMTVSTGLGGRRRKPAALTTTKAKPEPRLMASS
jgi:hypothetical protein